MPIPYQKPAPPTDDKRWKIVATRMRRLGDRPEALIEFLQTELLRTDSVKGRQMPHQDEIETAISGCIFDRHDVSRRLDHAQLILVATVGRADRAKLMFTEHPAATAMPDAVDGPDQRRPAALGGRDRKHAGGDRRPGQHVRPRRLPGDEADPAGR